MQVVVTGLQKLFGPKVGVDIPALQIAPGETFGLVGSNGAGKTTFLRLLLDLLKPSAGMVTIDGQSVATSANWKSSTGSYLDESFLLDFLTADEFFEFIGAAGVVTQVVVVVAEGRQAQSLETWSKPPLKEKARVDAVADAAMLLDDFLK